ncbi:hypothetical protein FV139_18030 [Parahaliea maris]|uniref:DUF1640 domain-containing protein n=1 Tax=Parahaliea maris TaxID=2716870 RepID=A0A5C8ZQT7_9GAMM|nr:hypothetical protein [Parahaliea maris]TXS90866.1 hypothetical protein FV139_18030 [Parahaliea maris]
MAAIAFDTLTCARRLIAAGIPEQQADVLAELMAQAFVHNVDQLVTKDYLDARFDAFEQRVERRIDERLTELETRLEKRFAQIDSRFAEMDKRFAEIDRRFAAFDQKFAEIDGKFRLLYWMLGIIIASTTVPALAKLLGLG